MDTLPNISSSAPQTQIATANFSSSGSAPIPPKTPVSPPEKKLAQYPGHKSLVMKILGVLVIIGVIGFFGLSFLKSYMVKKEEPVTLTYWGVLEDSNVMNTLIKDFEKDHPLIKITYLQQDQKNYLEKIITRTQNGTGPDIYSFHNSWTPMLSSLLLPLPTSVMNPGEFKEQYFPVVQHDVVYKGAIYGVPMGFDTLALFTNSQIFQAAGASIPVTWNDFSDTAKQLTVQGDNSQIVTAGAALGNTDNVNHATDILSLLFVQNGANLYDLSPAQQDVSEALQFFVNFQPDVWTAALDPSLLAFSKGNLAMYIGYSWDIFAIKAQNPSLTFEVHPMPSLADRKMTIASYWIEGASSASKHKKEVMQFMEYLAKKQTEQKFYDIAAKTRLFGEPFPRRDLAEGLKTNTLVAPFITQGDVAQSSYFISGIAESGINAKANAPLLEAVKNVENNTSPADSAASKMIPTVVGALSSYGYK